MHRVARLDVGWHIFLGHQDVAFLATVKIDSEGLLTAKGVRVRSFGHLHHLQIIIFS
jgi:hypothetical protein